MAQEQMAAIEPNSPGQPQQPKVFVPKVYVVDDDPDACKLISAILGTAGYGCLAFSSAEQFLGSVSIESPGCLLLDIRMPEITGPQLQTLMTQRGFFLPIIFLSAEAEGKTTVGVLRGGAVDLIEKPFDRDRLICAVKAAIARDGELRAERAELNELKRRLAELTPREREVAHILAQGNSNRKTAETLGLSERTVEIHRGRIMNKLKCGNVVNFGVLWQKLQKVSKPVSAKPPAM